MFVLAKKHFNLSIYICIIREIPINNVTEIFELWNKLQITARYCERRKDSHTGLLLSQGLKTMQTVFFVLKDKSVNL